MIDSLLLINCEPLDLNVTLSTVALLFEAILNDKVVLKFPILNSNASPCCMTTKATTICRYKFVISLLRLVLPCGSSEPTRVYQFGPPAVTSGRGPPPRIDRLCGRYNDIVGPPLSTSLARVEYPMAHCPVSTGSGSLALAAHPGSGPLSPPLPDGAALNSCRSQFGLGVLLWKSLTSRSLTRSSSFAGIRAPQTLTIKLLKGGVSKRASSEKLTLAVY